MIPKVPKPINEPIINFEKNSKDRELLKQAINEVLNKVEEIPLIIGGKEIKTDNVAEVVLPSDHKKVVAKFYKAGKEEVKEAIKTALEARKKWANMPWEERKSIFLKAAELLSKKYRYLLDAVVMLTQSKNPYQAEIDVAELIDFWRFNAYYTDEIYREQPTYSPTGMWNRLDYRPLEGFVLAIPPFNFVSIGGNLPTAPAMVGNVALWKPAATAVYSNYIVMKILIEAGLPAGVINFIPATHDAISEVALVDENLAGIHFTGSSNTFNYFWTIVGKNIAKYKTYPRIVGETGGKDFVFVHNSANVDEVVTALIRGAFEYQGQKCSAASRTYIPKSLWPQIKEKLEKEISKIKVGGPEDFTNFVNAVIDKRAYQKIVSYIDFAKEDSEAEIIIGGKYDDSKGYFIWPTVVVVTNPKHKLMEEEIFGPVLTVYVYEDEKYEETLKLCDETSPYGLTGAIFATDRYAIVKAVEILRWSAGNFYINDKPTGAVVGQQPFGGSRASGTNDKAGSKLNMLRWLTPRTIKETFNPPTDWTYPFMEE